MSLEERQQELIDELSIIPDATERFAWLVERTKHAPPIAEGDRIDSFRVDGCQSPLWIVPERSPESRWKFRAWSDAPIVHAMASLFCRLYDAAAASEIAAFEPTLLDDLQLTAHLTPNRRQGMRRIVEKIRTYAAGEGLP